ncbi:MAG: reductive dehalogenase [Chloroflexota bacterium]
MLAAIRRAYIRRKRPLHLGKFPMERIRRVPVPTTKINGDEVPRVPERSNFFFRSGHGDLGPKPQEGVKRFVNKYPMSQAVRDILFNQVPLQDGEVAPEQAPIPDDLEERAKHFKSLCYVLDADIVGICEAPEYVWYSHDKTGKPIDARHKYAIVILSDQGYETSAAASGDDWISGLLSMRAYHKGSNVSCSVAEYIRKLGYEAKAHTSASSEVLQLPLVLLAGLGEMSRIGEVVLNPFLGPRFKVSVVTTNLPMAVDQPIDFGLQDYCSKCMKCAKECPPAAISFGDKVMFNGYELWKPDVEACTRYRVTNPHGSSCGRCLKVCPFNKPNVLHHRFGLWLAVNVPASHRFLIWFDDLMEYGNRNWAWKWWWDLETVDGKVTQPKKTNDRQLRPDRNIPTRQKITLYPPETLPAPDFQGVWPVREHHTTMQVTHEKTLAPEVMKIKEQAANATDG